MVQMCSAWHIEWQMRTNRHNGLQASQTMLGLTVIHQIDFGCFSNLQRRRPGTPCNHSHQPWWNSISKRSLKDYWKSIWFCNFSGCGGGLLSFSEPCSVPKDLFISHSDQINRNQPESTGSAKTSAPSALSNDRPTGLVQMRIQPVQTAWRGISRRFVTTRCKSGNNSCLANLFKVSLPSTSAKYKTRLKNMQGASCFSCVGWQLLALLHPIASKPRLGLSLGRHSLTSGAYSEHEGHKYLIDYYSYYLNASVSHCSKWAMSQIINQIQLAAPLADRWRGIQKDIPGSSNSM